MLGIVVPVVVIDVGSVEAVVAVDIDVDVGAMPVAIAPHGGPHREPDTERDGRRSVDISGRVVVVGRVHGVCPGAVDHCGVIGGDIDNLGIGGLNNDGLGLAAGGLVLHGDRLLRVGLEVALGLGLLTQDLKGIHHALLVREKRVAELIGPSEFVVHHGQDLGKGRERFDAGVPALLLHGAFQGVAFHVGVGFHPACGLDNFKRVGGRHQDLGHQRIGVEGNGRHQGGELVRRNCFGSGAIRGT